MTPHEKQTICIVAAMSGPRRVIGKNNDLPWRGKVRGELKHFKETTTGGTVIMGRKTYESIGRPRPQRNNIVVSSTMQAMKGIDVCQSIDAAIEKATAYDAQIFIIGGAGIYKQTITIADKMVLSYIKQDYEGDAFFPDFDKSDWDVTSTQSYDDFDVVTYIRRG